MNRVWIDQGQLTKSLLQRGSKLQKELEPQTEFVLRRISRRHWMAPMKNPGLLGFWNICNQEFDNWDKVMNRWKRALGVMMATMIWKVYLDRRLLNGYALNDFECNILGFLAGIFLESLFRLASYFKLEYWTVWFDLTFLGYNLLFTLGRLIKGGLNNMGVGIFFAI